LIGSFPDGRFFRSVIFLMGGFRPGSAKPEEPKAGASQGLIALVI